MAYKVVYTTHAHTHTHRNLDFTGARDSEWQWHQLGHRPMQVCTSLQTDNHASTPPLSFLQAGCPSCCPTNSVKALKANKVVYTRLDVYLWHAGCGCCGWRYVSSASVHGPEQRSTIITPSSTTAAWTRGTLRQRTTPHCSLHSPDSVITPWLVNMWWKCSSIIIIFLKPISTTTTTTLLQPFNGPLSGTTQVSRYQKAKTNLDFTGARDSEW